LADGRGKVEAEVSASDLDHVIRHRWLRWDLQMSRHRSVAVRLSCARRLMVLTSTHSPFCCSETTVAALPRRRKGSRWLSLPDWLYRIAPQTASETIFKSPVCLVCHSPDCEKHPLQQPLGCASQVSPSEIIDHLIKHPGMKTRLDGVSPKLRWGSSQLWNLGAIGSHVSSKAIGDLLRSHTPIYTRQLKPLGSVLCWATGTSWSPELPKSLSVTWLGGG
jgi:hypothetical protein